MEKKYKVIKKKIHISKILNNKKKLTKTHDVRKFTLLRRQDDASRQSSRTPELTSAPCLRWVTRCQVGEEGRQQSRKCKRQL